MIRVVIADDERLWCQAFNQVVDWESRGFAIVGTAYTGTDALALCRSLRPDILLTDIRMPGLDGLELLRVVKEELPQTRVLILSGFSEFEYARTAVRYRADEYLLKTEAEFDTIIEAMERAAAAIGGAPAAGGSDATSVASSNATSVTSVASSNATNAAATSPTDRTARAQARRCFYGVAEDGAAALPAPCDAMQLVRPDEYMNAVSAGNWRYAFSALSTLMERARTRRDVSPEDLTNTLVWSVRVITLSRGELDKPDTARLLDGVRACKTLADAEARFEEARAAIFEPLLREQAQKGLATEAQAYVHAHIADDLSLSAVARAVHVSPAYLSTLFKAQTGVGFSQYVQARRIEQADRLLRHTGMLIREVALAAGFSNESYFTQAYKRAKGVSPRQYREETARGEAGEEF